MKRNGTLWAWGDNEYGQIGDGTTSDRLSPVQIGSDTDWVSVFTGGAHNLALKVNGELWTWGLNSVGQLGDGTTTTRLSPVRIGTYAEWGLVSAGWEHSVSLKEDGNIWTWGWNEYGQLGDGTSTNRLFPITLNVPRADFTASSLTGTALLTVNFINLSSAIDVPLSYQWDFDNDGTVDSTEGAPSFTYNGTGTYTVKLTVMDSDGDMDTLIKSDYVAVSCPLIRIQGEPPVFYPTIQDAYSEASDGDAIDTGAYSFTRDLSFNLHKTITLQGGYDCDFSAVAGTTVVNGMR